MTKKTTFYEQKLGEIIQVKCKIGLWFLSYVLSFINIYVIQVKCKIGLWFLSYVLSFINIYVCTRFNFNPSSTFIWPG